MKKVYLLIGFIAALSVFILGTRVVLASDPSFGLDKTAGAAKLDTYGKDVPTIAGNIIGTLLSMISVLFFVLILYGGILWMTARGSSENTEKALNTIIAATIGIIIIIGAYALTNFVFKLGGNVGGGGGSPQAANLCGNGHIDEAAGEQCDGDPECTAACRCTTPDCGGNGGGGDGDALPEDKQCSVKKSCTDIQVTNSFLDCQEADDLSVCILEQCDTGDAVCRAKSASSQNGQGETVYWNCLEDTNGGCAKFPEDTCEEQVITQGDRGRFCEWK